MNRLKLNDEKTEFLLVGTRQQLAKLCVEPLAVGDHLIAPCEEAKNLGCWFDQQLSMVTNIKKIVVHHTFICIMLGKEENFCQLSLLNCLCMHW